MEEGSCRVCRGPASQRCVCGTVSYCGRACQRTDWIRHKAACSAAQRPALAAAPAPAPAPAAAPAPEPASARPAPASTSSGGVHIGAPPITGDLAAWATGLSAVKRAEWLVDCYRMRIDDEYAWGGGLRGLYDPDATTLDIVKDFLVFTKLAVARKALPANWRWPAFLDYATANLGFAFEKSDAQTKYGSENIFDGTMGGRSLRYTAMAIYGREMMDQRPYDGELATLNDTISPLAQQALLARTDLFEDVGGVDQWRRLLQTVVIEPRR